MKSIHLMIGLVLLACISNSFASGEAKERRIAIEKAIAKEPPLHRQIQLAIFDAFEARKAGPGGKTFYEKHNLVPEKFIKLVCERNFTGEEGFKNMDAEIRDLERRQKGAEKLLESTANQKRVELCLKRISVMQARIYTIREWKKIAFNPDKEFSTNPAPKYFTYKLASLTEAGLGALGHAPADQMGAVNIEKLRKRK